MIGEKCAEFLVASKRTLLKICKKCAFWLACFNQTWDNALNFVDNGEIACFLAEGCSNPKYASSGEENVFMIDGLDDGHRFHLFAEMQIGEI